MAHALSALTARLCAHMFLRRCQPCLTRDLSSMCPRATTASRLRSVMCWRRLRTTKFQRRHALSPTATTSISSCSPPFRCRMIGRCSLSVTPTDASCCTCGTRRASRRRRSAAARCSSACATGAIGSSSCARGRTPATAVLTALPLYLCLTRAARGWPLQAIPTATPTCSTALRWRRSGSDTRDAHRRRAHQVARPSTPTRSSARF
mmetsp:Transcript_52976/g.121664  ORF Transcript_52976/g.121664 Transcript_52976/m.121664 type:complete len:206 (-) Transcript_52976:913-1530(-)